jgi:hypothetical protein
MEFNPNFTYMILVDIAHSDIQMMNYSVLTINVQDFS